MDGTDIFCIVLSLKIIYEVNSSQYRHLYTYLHIYRQTDVKTSKIQRNTDNLIANECGNVSQKFSNRRH